MVSEGRGLQSLQHGQKGVNSLLIDSAVLPVHVVELIVSGSRDEMHEHWHRAADVYQKAFTHQDVPCTVQVFDRHHQLTQLHALHCLPH